MKIFNFKEYTASSKEDVNTPLLKTILNNKVYRFFIGAVIGAGAGYLYWTFIGCTGGTCPLTSDPYRTIGLFAIIGGFIFKDKKQK